MAWPWPASESTAEVIPAFVAALQAVEDVVRNKRADIELKTGAKVRYGYADLDAVLEAVKPMLTAQGLAITQPAASDGVHGIVMHSSGEWLSFPPLQIAAGQATPQAQGSAISYGRRYQMLALLNIATEDDDGKAGGAKPRKADAASTDNDTSSGSTRMKRNAPAAPATTDSDAPSQAQTKKAMALFAQIGVNERSERLSLTSAYLNRDVASWKEVTKQEAVTVIDRLEQAAVGT